MDQHKNFEWETDIPAIDYGAEMKKIRKSLRKRNLLTIATCLVLVAVLTFASIQYGIPLLEKQYWDPYASTYDEDVPDLHITMAVYTELFIPQYDLCEFEIADTGFAAYDITANFSKYTCNNTVSNFMENPRTATLYKNDLRIPAGFWDYTGDNPFNCKGSFSERRNKVSVSSLGAYPDYVNVLAAVTFKEDIPANDLEKMNTGLSSPENLRLIWAAVRTSSEDSGAFPVCGVSLTGYPGIVSDAFGNDSEYPYLLNKKYTEQLETHFQSMLRFMADRQEQDRGILPEYGAAASYYADALEYVETNGVMAYGGFFIGSPSALLALYESGKISSITLCDAWINY